MRSESLEGSEGGRRFALVSSLVGACVLIAALAGLGPGVRNSNAFAAVPPELWTRCDGEGPEDGESTDIQCSIPRGVAANPEDGHVFVGDQENFRLVEFNALGNFIRTWGWDVVESGPGDGGAGFEICTPLSGDVCQAGDSGAGSGQFSAALGVAIDSAGSVYVVDFSNRRVEKFSAKGEFLLMFGGDVNKTKVDAAAPEAERNLCPVDPGDVCQAGTAGTGKGQFGEWAPGSFIAIDPSDKVYVGDANRIQRFDAGGHYVEDLPEDPAGELGESTVQSLATDGTGNLYVTYSEKPDVRKLTPAGKELATPRFRLPPTGSFKPVPTAVAVDADGHVYAFGPTSCCSSQGNLNPIFEFDPEGNVDPEGNLIAKNLLANFGKGEFDASTGLATNLCEGSEAPGNLYVSNTSESKAFLRAYGTEPIGCFKARTLPASDIQETAATLNGTVNPKGEAVSECFFEYGTSTAYGQIAACEEPGATEIGTGNVPVPVHVDVGSLAAGTVYHFRLIGKVGAETEPGADLTFKTLGPPVISEDHTVSATHTEASLKALVNPEGFATSCHFEYGTDTSYGQSTPAQAIGKDEDRTDHVVIVTLEDLTPGTTYHWRIVCANASETSEGEDHVAATYRRFTADTECPNQPFRVAASAFLPDCRAYEMVSPVDKNGSDVVTALESPGAPGGYIQASADGERITYTVVAGPSFGDQPSNLGFNQYLATRQGKDWSNHGIGVPVSGHNADQGSAFGAFRSFMAFSPDLCSAWLFDQQTPPPSADGQVGHRNLYRRENCGPGAGNLEALTPAPPPLPADTIEGYVDNQSVQGGSADSRHAFFAAGAALTPEAAAGTDATQVYDRFGGANHLVSVLPGGAAYAAGATVGSGWGRNLDNAVSADGSRAYWTAGLDAGVLYLRLHPEQGAVAGECGDAAKACTLAVSADITTPDIQDAFFWTAAADGSKALYSEGQMPQALESGTADLYEFDLGKAEEEPRLVTADLRGVLGAAEDLSRIYFVSNVALPDAGKNSEEEEAAPGKPNLYLDEGGTRRFVATLEEGDLGVGESPYNVAAYYSTARAARVSADGAHLVFQSRAPLTGFDNIDANSGEPDVEVFTYEAGGALRCISCNPSGARPSGGRLPPPYRRIPTLFPFEVAELKFWAAAWIPTWEHPLHDSNVLSADGGRVFFNSNDALLPRDTNGAQDVYQWEAPGTGRCDVEDADYFPQNGGCLELISSGESPSESEFWEASPDGEDVFFTTESSLLPQDPGLIDLYDARVGGGFAQPTQPVPCEGEACQSPSPPPGFPTPASGAYRGPGNPPRGAKRCPRGKRKVRRKGKTRCAKKGRHRHAKSGSRQRAHRNPGADR